MINESWTNVTANGGTGPSPRVGSGFACDTTDSKKGTCILTGGYTYPPGVFHSDTWSLVNGKWTNLSVANPYGGAVSIGFAWDPADHEFLEFGASISSGPFENHYATFNDTTNTWSASLAMSAIGTSSMSNNGLAWDDSDGYMITVGGQMESDSTAHDTCFPYTYSFIGGVWSNISATAGTSWTPRMSPGVSTNATSVFMFGGEKYGAGDVGDLWRFYKGAWAQLSPTGGPPRARDGAGMADINASAAVLFGGANRSTVGGVNGLLNDTWLLTFSPPTWTNLSATLASAPPGKLSGMMAQNSTNLTYSFGGQTVGPTKDYSALWTFAVSLAPSGSTGGGAGGGGSSGGGGGYTGAPAPIAGGTVPWPLYAAIGVGSLVLAVAALVIVGKLGRRDKGRQVR